MEANLSDKIANYRPTEAAIELVRTTKLLFVAGTSGSGKNTIIDRLLQKPQFSYLVSHTTRRPRTNEKNGKNYFFIDQETATAMIEEQRFVEVKIVHEKSIYGTSVEEVQRVKEEDKIGVTDIDVQGVAELVTFNPDIRAAFLLPPSHDEWMRRLAYRGHQDQDALQIRLQTAERELEHALKAGHFHFIINADLAKATAEVEELATIYDLPPNDQQVEHAWHVLGELKRDLDS
jgi:guanylate kinase